MYIHECLTWITYTSDTGTCTYMVDRGSRSWRGKETGKSIDTLITCSYKNGVVPDVLFLIGETEINKGESLVTAIEGK